MAIFSKAYGTTSGDNNFDESADLNGDGVIDDQDIAMWLIACEG
jgi:hypothetical protein